MLQQKRLFAAGFLALGLASGLALAVKGGVARSAKETMLGVSANPLHKKVAANALGNAQRALDRAEDARAAGDAQHAELLEYLAGDWALTARDLSRTVDAEAHAQKLEEEAAELEAKAVSALSIIEATVARKARAEHKLKTLEESSVDTSTVKEP